MENAKVKLGDTEATRIGLDTNRLTNTCEHIAFLKEAVADGVNISTLPIRMPAAKARRQSVLRSRRTRMAYVVATKGGYRAGEGSPDVAGRVPRLAQPPVEARGRRLARRPGDASASVADVDAIGERFRPWCTLAAVYLYRSRRRATQPASE